MSADRDGADAVKPKGKYHHGDLKEALIQAAYALVSQRGAENFSLADACRLAGVSTAAPYKHFRDRDEILEAVVTRGFDVLSDRSMAAVRTAGEGTLAGIVAMGEAYVRFAVDEQGLFRLMFGQHPVLKQSACVVSDGKRCFTQVIEQVALYCARNGVAGDADLIAIRLWTFVHGASALIIDGDYAVVAPDLDVGAMIRDATPLLLMPTARG
ncbi:MAG: TetR/AcrR family transcriptional regulator [Rhodospirillales bacterium]|nr:TetR/AcrR family transcriptional regulator [Rhodospirillales bacterium]